MKFSVCLILFLLLNAYKLYGIQDEICRISQETENLEAFSKVYGYVKYFHPSDEAYSLDWDDFAVYGVKRIRSVQSKNELKTVLEELFKSIAPSIEFSLNKPRKDDFIKSNLKNQDRDTTGLTTVAWQHLGLDRDVNNNGCCSGRVNHPATVWNKSFFLTQQIDVSKLRGKEVLLQATLLFENQGPGSYLELYIFMDDEKKESVIINNDRRGSDDTGKDTWQVETKIGESAHNVTIGVFMKGTGMLRIDDINLKVKKENGEWDLAVFQNSGFKKGPYDKPAGWDIQKIGYFESGYKTDESNAKKESFLIESPPKLFQEYPGIGEVFITKLMDSLWAVIPLAVFHDGENTLPESPAVNFESLKTTLKSVNYGSNKNQNVSLASMIIAWNELQHFYPYFDVIDTNWEQQQRISLQEILSYETGERFDFIFEKMLASLRDGHIYVSKTPNSQAKTRFPFHVDWIEESVVVIFSEDNEIKPGDIIRSVDGIPSEDMLRSQMELISGSGQYKRYRSLQRFAAGDFGSSSTLLLERDGDRVEMKASRKGQRQDRSFFEKQNLSEITRLENDIYYVDLDRASMSQIRIKIDEISSATAVIFDLRGYPNSNQNVLRYLITEPDTSGQWLQIPKIIYPDQNNVVGYEKLGWHLKPAKPKIQGEVVFITDARAISNAESVMSFVEHYQLGEIVGQPTAGTNGGVISIYLPNGYSFRWTGVRVLKHDGSQHHLIGIQPTIPVQKTIQGVRKGKDEFLEKAIEILQKNK